jgi:hypothetical protein
MEADPDGVERNARMEFNEDGYRSHVERSLLGGYVPAAVRLHAAGTSYTEKRVERWLTSLAIGLRDRGANLQSATDIRSFDWWLTGRTTGTAQAQRLAALVLAAAPYFYLTISAPKSAFGLVILSVLFAFLPITFLLTYIPMLGPRLRLEFGLGRAMAQLVAVSCVLILFIWSGALSIPYLISMKAEPLAGLIIGILFIALPILLGVAFYNMVMRSQLRTPAKLIVSMYLFAFGIGLELGFSGAVIARHDFSFAFKFALVSGFASTLPIWSRYHFPAFLSVFRGNSPLRFNAFLEWAVPAGLLRVSGVAYQFRHRQLQDWLTLSEQGMNGDSPMTKIPTN